LGLRGKNPSGYLIKEAMGLEGLEGFILLILIGEEWGNLPWKGGKGLFSQERFH